MRRALGIVLALAALAAVAPAATQARERFDTRVLAKVPAPGYPAQAYVHPNGRVYEGTYINPNAGAVPSRVFEFDGQDGTLLRSWSVPGQNLSGQQAVQVTTSDANGDLVILDNSPARVLKLDRDTGDFRVYSTFADVEGGAEPRPNYGAWGPDGSLYVTDYGQGLIWRVPPGGGPAVVWLRDAKLEGSADFGTTGLALAGDRRTLLVAQGSSAIGNGELNPATGKIYRVPIDPAGRPGALTKLWESAAGDVPDGFAIAANGRLYVPMVGLSAQIAVVAPDGREIERFPRAAGSGENGSPVPFDSPSSARFLGTRLIVANQSALAGDRREPGAAGRGGRRDRPWRADPRPRRHRPQAHEGVGVAEAVRRHPARRQAPARTQAPAGARLQAAPDRQRAGDAVRPGRAAGTRTLAPGPVLRAQPGRRTAGRPVRRTREGPEAHARPGRGPLPLLDPGRRRRRQPLAEALPRVPPGGGQHPGGTQGRSPLGLGSPIPGRGPATQEEFVAVRTHHRRHRLHRRTSRATRRRKRGEAEDRELSRDQDAEGQPAGRAGHGPLQAGRQGQEPEAVGAEDPRDRRREAA